MLGVVQKGSERGGRQPFIRCLPGVSSIFTPKNPFAIAPGQQDPLNRVDGIDFVIVQAQRLKGPALKPVNAPVCYVS